MKKKMLVVLGQTSTGKTDLALLLAKKLNGELISADSRQVYKYLDIGTGKEPGKKSKIKKQKEHWEIDGIKIQLYDVVNPKTRFNLHEFILKAEEVVEKVIAEGKLPILVGGTGLYIRSLLEGISDFGIKENKELRKNIEKLNLEEIKKRINKADSGILKKLNNSEINNKRRLTRIFEKLSSKESDKSYIGLEKKFEVLKIGLRVERKILAEKIKERVISRIDQGMIEESQKLLARGILNYERMDQLGLEYRYEAKFLKGEIKTKEELVNILSIKIGQFAKRQETWFKKEKGVVWFDISDIDYINKVEEKTLNWYNT